MRLLVQPTDGVKPLIRAIEGARRSISIVIFRFDYNEIERALTEAVTRGVTVHALIAHTNRSGEEALRKLEMRLLAAGVNVARTAGNLLRYHSKMMIVDGRDLYLLAFNYTHADIQRSRSFAVVSRSPVLVREAARLIEADSTRQDYATTSKNFVVSPVNARKVLRAFIKGAQKELLIYDPKVSDPAILRLLEERAAAGVDVRLLGKIARNTPGVKVCKLAKLRLHTRSMVRDGETAFVGSQSLRALELDGRREAGIIFRDAKAVATIRETFQADWDQGAKTEEGIPQSMPAVKVAKKVAKAVTKELPDLAPMVAGAVQEVGTDVAIDAEQVEAVVKDAVKAAVKEAISGILDNAADEGTDAA